MNRPIGNPGTAGPAGSGAAPRRGGALVAMAVGGAIGLVAAQAIDSSTGGADPAFAGGIGSVLGAALGRSGWIRMNVARSRGVHPALAIGSLVARIVGCLLIGLSLFGNLNGAARIAATVGGVALLVATAIGEHRWISRAAGHPAATPTSTGGRHDA